MKIPIRERRERGVCTRGHEGYVLKEIIADGWTGTRLTYGPNVGWRLNRNGERKPYCLQCHREQVRGLSRKPKLRRQTMQEHGDDLAVGDVDGVTPLADVELLYAATARCQKCSAGLAYELDVNLAIKSAAWRCSRVLKGECVASGHDVFPFAMYKVREESSINNRDGHTTRPEGTVCLTVGYATCPECKWKWKSEPYRACGLSHHWFSGPCPECGYSVGASGCHSSTEGEPIELFYEQMAARDKLSQEQRNELTRASEAVVGTTSEEHPA